MRQGRYTDAAAALEEAIAIAPGVAVLHCNLGFVFSQLGRLDEAVECYGRALQQKPELVDAHFSRAILLERLGRGGEALAGFERVLALKPDHVGAHLGRGNLLQALQRLEDAITSYDRAVAIDPANPAAHFNRGNALAQVVRNTDALAAFDRALAIDAMLVPAHNNRAGVLSKLGRQEEALAGFDAALALVPDDPELLTNRGNTLNELKRHDEALACHAAAVAQKPDFAKAHVNRGIALFDVGRLGEAIAAYDRAIALDPALADAHYGRAIALAQLRRHGEALESYERAHALNPRLPFLFGKLLHQKAVVCDWSSRDADVAELARRIERGESVSPPFPMLSLIDAPDIHRKASAIYARERALSDAAAIAPYGGHERIRLGYFSADFHDHATAVLMAEMFERHDRERFELFAFSFGADTQDAMRQRLRGAFDHFFDVRLSSDGAVAALARRHEIDIAVDLKGYTGEARPGIFGHRAAPVQVNYLGYPGTLGTPWCDYIIADATLIPTSDREHYAEKVVVLPGSYQPNTRRMPAKALPSRAEAGLPDSGFVYCCFNNVYKISPDLFRNWMRILARVKGSVLWLLDENVPARENLRKEAARAGIAPDRLVFAPRVPLPEHLARHRHADLFLDTLPYNAHTTASDALWMGLPVLTQRGRSFAGRVSASLLNAVGLPELITESADAYEGTAIALASEPGRLAALQQKLAANRDSAPLFNVSRSTRHIEAAFAAMHAPCQAGLPPDHIDVAS